MKLHDLAPDPGSSRPRKRVGLGNAGKGGTYGGRGRKGQWAREGGGKKAYFEGGQLPFVRRLPFRRGFKSPFRIRYTAVNIADLDQRFAAGSDVTVEQLVAGGILSGRREPYKILGEGSLSKALKVHAPRFAAAARQAIEAAGGECLATPAPDRRAILRHRRRRQ